MDSGDSAGRPGRMDAGSRHAGQSCPSRYCRRRGAAKPNPASDAETETNAETDSDGRTADGRTADARAADARAADTDADAKAATDAQANTYTLITARRLAHFYSAAYSEPT
jgi:hypothetical protein